MTPDYKPLTIFSSTPAAIEFDHVAEARATLADEYDRGFDAGRLLGQIEAFALTVAIAGLTGIITFLWMTTR
jgi:hypothetical protein